jgi:hypothetical protein
MGNSHHCIASISLLLSLILCLKSPSPYYKPSHRSTTLRIQTHFDQNKPGLLVERNKINSRCQAQHSEREGGYPGEGVISFGEGAPSGGRRDPNRARYLQGDVNNLSKDINTPYRQERLAEDNALRDQRAGVVVPCPYDAMVFKNNAALAARQRFMHAPVTSVSMPQADRDELATRGR